MKLDIHTSGEIDVACWTDEDEEAREQEAAYEAKIERELRDFEESQRCPFCRGFIPEECDGDHSNDSASYEFDGPSLYTPSC